MYLPLFLPVCCNDTLFAAPMTLAVASRPQGGQGGGGGGGGSGAAATSGGGSGNSEGGGHSSTAAAGHYGASETDHDHHPQRNASPGPSGAQKPLGRRGSATSVRRSSTDSVVARQRRRSTFEGQLVKGALTKGSSGGEINQFEAGTAVANQAADQLNRLYSTGNRRPSQSIPRRLSMGVTADAAAGPGGSDDRKGGKTGGKGSSGEGKGSNGEGRSSPKAGGNGGSSDHPSPPGAHHDSTAKASRKRNSGAGKGAAASGGGKGKAAKPQEEEGEQEIRGWPLWTLDATDDVPILGLWTAHQDNIM